MIACPRAVCDGCGCGSSFRLGRLQVQAAPAAKPTKAPASAPPLQAVASVSPAGPAAPSREGAKPAASAKGAPAKAAPAPAGPKQATPAPAQGPHQPRQPGTKEAHKAAKRGRVDLTDLHPAILRLGILPGFLCFSADMLCHDLCFSASVAIAISPKHFIVCLRQKVSHFAVHFVSSIYFPKTNARLMLGIAFLHHSVFCAQGSSIKPMKYGVVTQDALQCYKL